MPRNPSISAKLASLTAVGAGAIALTAGTAEAGIIYAPLSLHVGFDSGYSFGQSTTLAGSAKLSFHVFGGSNAYAGIRGVEGTFFRLTSHGSQIAGSFQTHGCGCGTMQLVNSGAVLPGTSTGWGAIGSTLVGRRSWAIGYSSSFANTRGNAAFSDEYALFRFMPTSTSPYLYGWLELSLTMTADVGVNPGDGPDVDVIAYGYDDSGATIAAGETPEPASFAQGVLAALIFGAEGLRRWRRARRTATSS